MINDRVWNIVADSFDNILIRGLTVSIPLAVISFAFALLIAVATALVQFADIRGLKQIARAIATNPEIIFFDEPTSALDPELTWEVLNVMRKLADEGMTMLIVTHEMNFARTVSNKVIFMENGSVVENGKSMEFFEHPREERSKAFLQSMKESISCTG